jgi:predicted O-methyltransferase YrrM
MSQELWSEVDASVEPRLLDPDPLLDQVLAASADAGLPAIALTPAHARYMHLLARVHGARSILELGTLGGYSTIWLGRALPSDGRLVSLELDPRYAELASANVERAGLAGLIKIIVGPALDSLRGLIAEGAGPFDFIFIDADKENTPEYFQSALELSRAGTLIVTDNVVRDGAIVDADSQDPRAQGMRRFHELLAADRLGPRRVSATTIQTVGAKGYDGFTIALVEHP